MEEFKEYFDSIISFMDSHFPDINKEEIRNLIEKEYGNIIPLLPDIGGNKNIMTPLLINSVPALAVMRALELKGIAIRDIGEFYYDWYETVFELLIRSAKSNNTEVQNILLSKSGMFNKETLDILKIGAKASQSRTYLEDFVYEFVEGDGETFDYGINFTECAVHKFYKKLNAEKFLSFGCMSDFAMARAAGYGFTRTQSIWNGAPFCDFRYIKEGNTLRGWPLENLPEFKN